MPSLSGKLILASASPRRGELLDLMALRHDVIPSTVDETLIPADHPRTFAIRAAYAKAMEVAGRAHEGDLVLAADTIVTRSMMIYGKPRDHHDAQRILRQLSGQSHQVITGVALALAGASEVHLDSETTEVIFRSLSESEMAAYIRKGNNLDKAGAYGIQDPEGAALIEEIRGDYFNVMGLPCRVVERLLAQAGWPFAIRLPDTPPRWRQK